MAQAARPAVDCDSKKQNRDYNDMKLFYKAGACSLTTHIVLHETGLPHTSVAVDLKTKRTAEGDDFLAINSKGYVPALQLDNGHVLTEGAVIAQYLVDLKPESHLLAASGEARYAVLEWMNFISTELHKGIGAFFNPAITPEWKAAATATLTKRLDWLAEALGDNRYLYADHFTIADAYLFNVLSWFRVVDFSLDRWPALQRFAATHAQRPSVIAAMKSEGLM